MTALQIYRARPCEAWASFAACAGFAALVWLAAMVTP